MYPTSTPQATGPIGLVGDETFMLVESITAIAAITTPMKQLRTQAFVGLGASATTTNTNINVAMK
jgi:hypothetical protein